MTARVSPTTGESASRPTPIFDDATILALCSDDTPTPPQAGLQDSVPEGEVRQGQPPFSFGMDGSTINIHHSRDIHFGPKTVTPSPQPPSYSHGGQSPCPSFDPGGEESLEDGFSLASSSITSLNTHFGSLDLSGPQVQRVDGQGVPNSPVIRLGEGETRPFFPRQETPVEDEATSERRSSEQSSNISSVAESSLRVIRKSVSTPISSLSRGSSPLQCLTQGALISAAPQCLQQRGQMGNAGTAPQMSAAISNSSNVHMGTRIVYNYYISDADQRHATHPSRPSTVSLPDSSNSFASLPSQASVDTPKDFLVEFREKLINRYQKRTRSSPLPWHRGKHVIPISEYYTEPQVFSVDKCGNRTSETVDIMSILNSKNETRFLVEGEAGMGKTLLATKLAEEWANGVQLRQFQILLLITLGDFKGSLQQYVKEELLPSYFKPENFEKVWEYCKTHDKDILFVLDGYDELERQDKIEIQSLMKCKDFPESKVVVTSRPNFLQEWEKKIVVSGFGQLQIMEFIEKYFKAIGKQNYGQSLRRIIEKDEKYWKLAKRPLFCVLMCMLYITGDVGEALPDRQSDIMLQIILCLIKWNRKNSGNSSIGFDSLPQEYEKPFLNFGKLCLYALSTEKSRFTDQEVQQVEGFESKLEQLGFLFTDNESHALGVKRFWKPVHQTFLEYLGAFYIAKHIRDCRGCKECKGYGLVFQRSQEVLKFCIGILNNKAYKVLDGQRFPFLWKLSVTTILRLLKEAEPKSENFQAIAKLLDQNTVEISTSKVEFEGWSNILSQPFRRLKSLKIAWRIKSRSPDQESSFTEASEAQYQSFFEALKNNESIQSIHVRAKLDGETFTDEKISLFFTHLQTAFFKKNLHELHIMEMKMDASSSIRKTFEVIANQPLKAQARPFHDLRVLKIHTFMGDQDLKGICDALGRCAPALETLHLEGLEHSPAGFQSLVKLLKGNSNIKNLYISMNQSLFVNVLGSRENSTEDYAPTEMGREYKVLKRVAGRRSKHAFTEHAQAQTAREANTSETEHDQVLETEQDECKEQSTSSMKRQEPDPGKELAFLFDRIPLNNGQWSIEARHQWFLKKSSTGIRIPLPLCVHREHKSVFHFLFGELPKTHVRNLTLEQAGLYLETPDLICLGDAVRRAPHLTSLNLQGLDKAENCLPLLIGMGQSPSLSSVNLSSSKILLRDTSFEVVCAALQSNTSLRSVSLKGWQFHLQNTKDALHRLKKLLDCWQVVQLDLKQCLIELGSYVTSVSQPQSPPSPCSQPLNAFFTLPIEPLSQPWKSLKIISMEGAELKEITGLVYRGHLLLSGLTNFVNLTSLDLSVSHMRTIQVDNIATRRFFGLIGSEMKHLVELKLDNWEFCLQNMEGGSSISSSLQSCRKLRKIQLENANENIPDVDHSASWCKLTFLHHLISYVPNVEEVSLCCYKINGCHLDHDLAVRVSQCLHDHWHHLPFTVKFFRLPPEINNAIYNTLKRPKRPPCRVKRTQGPSPITVFEVQSVLKLMKL